MEEISHKAWTGKQNPKCVVVIRMQAMGDVVITLPYLNDFKQQLPNTKLILVTTEEVSAIPRSLVLFDRVITIGGGRNARLQFFFMLCRLPFLISLRPVVVMDLQNNKISRTLRRLLLPQAWCSFDRFTPHSAGERTRRTIESLGLTKITMNISLSQRIDKNSIEEKLKLNGWKKDHALIVLNPAGAFDTRHWPLENYMQLALLLKSNYPGVQFLLLGLRSKIEAAARYWKSSLHEDLIDMTDQTSAEEAFAIVKMAKLMITEDSGLMHMAWTQQVPTLALFGSTRSDWSAPQGSWSICLDSSDLACGNCMLAACIYGDNRCLTRYSPQQVFEKAMILLKA